MSESTQDSGSSEEGADENARIARRRLLLGGGMAAASARRLDPPGAGADGGLSAALPRSRYPIPGRKGQAIAADGSVVPAGTQGSFPGSGRPFTGEEVKAALRGRNLPGTSYEQNRAYLNYIRRLQGGTSGFTCYASLQMPR
jgi:hypothetical protein